MSLAVIQRGDIREGEGARTLQPSRRVVDVARADAGVGGAQDQATVAVVQAVSLQVKRRLAAERPLSAVVQRVRSELQRLHGDELAALVIHPRGVKRQRCSAVNLALLVVKPLDVIGACTLTDQRAAGVVQLCRGQVNATAAAEYALSVIDIARRDPLVTVAAYCPASIIKQAEDAQRQRLPGVCRAAGIVQGLCVKRQRVAALQPAATVIQFAVQVQAQQLLTVQLTVLAVVQAQGGNVQCLSRQPLAARIVDCPGVGIRSRALHGKQPLRGNLAAVVIDILRNVQHQVRRRLQGALRIAQPVRCKLHILLALHAALRVVKAAADGVPAALAAHPATDIDNVLRVERLRQLTENTSLTVIQLPAELHVQAVEGVDSPLSIQQVCSAHPAAADAGQGAALVVPFPVKAE
ncbi:Uncharacterised protein [Klebsiella pneumoniae]|nr:Uncharacterised protein [Klebsiella pneumoniae]